MKIHYVLSVQTLIQGLVHSNLQALQRVLLDFNTEMLKIKGVIQK